MRPQSPVFTCAELWAGLPGGSKADRPPSLVFRRPAAVAPIAIVQTLDQRAYLVGALSNEALQDAEQKYNVLPPKTELPAARFGSTIIPHTGSFSMGHLLACALHSCGLNRRSVIEFITTDTELKPIAAPATIGFSTIPIPASTPAAIGMSAVL